ncbi:hypothetical protein D3C87_1715620 [compost metagenome]
MVLTVYEDETVPKDVTEHRDDLVSQDEKVRCPDRRRGDLHGLHRGFLRDRYDHCDHLCDRRLRYLVDGKVQGVTGNPRQDRVLRQEHDHRQGLHHHGHLGHAFVLQQEHL